jgi:(S)-mandelate dehydrogenase
MNFDLPFWYTPRNVMDFARSPHWGLHMLREHMPVLKNLIDFFRDTKSPMGIASPVGNNYYASLSWDFIKSMRGCWPRKLIIKDILRPDVSERVANIVYVGSIMSNHGGRQLWMA